MNVLSMFQADDQLSSMMTADVVDWNSSEAFSTTAQEDADFGLGANSLGGADAASDNADASSAVGCSVRLSRLRLNLSLHLHQCMEASIDFGAGGSDAEESQRTALRNPFGKVLCYTSELLTIIRSFVDQQTAGHPVPSISNFVSGTVNLVTMLDILCAHTQIVSIYDTLLQRLYAKLSDIGGAEAPDLPTPQLQTLPGLQLAGFPVIQGNLQTKILVQAILHQLELLERELSLPKALRVSKRAETYPDGLIRRDPRTQHVVNSFFASSAQYATEHVDSLKRTISQLESRLEI